MKICASICGKIHRTKKQLVILKNVFVTPINEHVMPKSNMYRQKNNMYRQKMYL